MEVMGTRSIRISSNDFEKPRNAGHEQPCFSDESPPFDQRRSNLALQPRERRVFLRGHVHPVTKGVPQRAPFLEYPILMPQPLTHDDQIRHGNTLGRDVFFGGSFSPLRILQMRRAVCQL